MSRTRTSPRIRYCIKNLQVLQGWKEGAIAVNGHGRCGQPADSQSLARSSVLPRLKFYFIYIFQYRETKPDMTDYRAQFKAAKAQRESAVPGKLVWDPSGS